jgi:hypothetical protein
MAARYVNPDNVVAQGLSFYTGLVPGSYDRGGSASAGRNAFGAGSGGTAGVSADRTGSDASKVWNYQQSITFQRQKESDMDRLIGVLDPGGSGEPGGAGEPAPEAPEPDGGMPEPDMPGREPYGPTSVGKPGVPDTQTGTSSGPMPGGPGWVPPLTPGQKGAKTRAGRRAKNPEYGKRGPNKPPTWENWWGKKPEGPHPAVGVTAGNVGNSGHHSITSDPSSRNSGGRSPSGALPINA